MLEMQTKKNLKKRNVFLILLTPTTAQAILLKKYNTNS